jgi:hypothetical protein
MWTCDVTRAVVCERVGGKGEGHDLPIMLAALQPSLLEIRFLKAGMLTRGRKRRATAALVCSRDITPKWTDDKKTLDSVGCSTRLDR